MLNQHQLEKEFVETRINIIFVLTIFFFALFFTGFWYLQIIRGPYYATLAHENILKNYPIPAPRGLIVDRNNEVLAENRISHNLFVTPRLSRNLKNTLQFLSNVLATTPEELHRSITKEGHIQSLSPVLVYQDLSLPQLAYISARKIEYPEIEVKQEPRRNYKYGSLFSHTIGYVGELTDMQERNREFPEAQRRDYVGQAGMERHYNKELMGERGYDRKIVNSYGQELKEFKPYHKAAIPGHTLRIGLDYGMQKAARDAFIEKGKLGSAAAINIKTGEVMVLYSSPEFDPNDFIPKILPQKWKELLTDPGHPLQNRAIQNRFSPGSTFKIVMALAALQEQKINPQTTFYCSGGQFIYNRVFRCWKPGGHGGVSLYKAIMQSCDVYFYNLGMRMDIDLIAKYSRKFGLGELTGIDLQNEAKGIVPSREWKMKTQGDKWYPGETISVAIGQGPILVTALQMAALTASVASDGHYMQPLLLSSIVDHRGKVLQVPKHEQRQISGIDRENYELVKRALWGVVNDRGTGGRARIDGYDVCGKTGTVQVVGYDRGGNLSEREKDKYGDHAWFVSFAPFSDPQVALAVFVQHGGHGSEAAAPVAHKILETYFRDRKIPAYAEPEFVRAGNFPPRPRISLTQVIPPESNQEEKPQ